MLMLSTPHICHNHNNRWSCNKNRPKNNDRYEVWCWIQCWGLYWCWCMKLSVPVSVWCVSVKKELWVETQVPGGKGELTGNKVKTGKSNGFKKNSTKSQDIVQMFNTSHPARKKENKASKWCQKLYCGANIFTHETDCDGRIGTITTATNNYLSIFASRMSMVKVIIRHD